MEVRRRGRDIAQARDTSELGLRGAQSVKDAMTLEKMAADIHALMTRDAAERLEQLVTGELVGTDGARFAGKPTIETATRGKQRALVGGNRIQKGGSVGRASVRIAEFLRHRRVGTYLGDGF